MTPVPEITPSPAASDAGAVFARFVRADRAAARARRLPLGPRADPRERQADDDRGGLRGGRGHRREATTTSWRPSSATCCCRSCSTPRSPRSAGRSGSREVIERVAEKMVRRHPHVFGDDDAATSGEVLRNWEAIKAEERAARRARTDALDARQRLTRRLPAVMEAFQITTKASRVGFDWKDAAAVLEKLDEEALELRGGRAEGDGPARGEVAEEVGDLLFVAVNVARLAGRRSRERAQGRQPQVPPPLPPHRGAAALERAQARRLDPRGDGPRSGTRPRASRSEPAQGRRRAQVLRSGRGPAGRVARARARRAAGPARAQRRRQDDAGARDRRAGAARRRAPSSCWAGRSTPGGPAAGARASCRRRWRVYPLLSARENLEVFGAAPRARRRGAARARSPGRSSGRRSPGASASRSSASRAA